LDGLDDGDVVESYAGFFTVTKSTDSNMFFWFIPATVSSKRTVGQKGGQGMILPLEL
jgi:hypothetical protein